MNAKLLVVGTLAGALTLFAWDSVSNTVIPWRAAAMRAFADSNAVVDVIKANAPESGMYVEMRGLLVAGSFTPDVWDKSTLVGPMLLLNKWSRVRTDEWGGGRADGGLPSSADSPTSSRRS